MSAMVYPPRGTVLDPFFAGAVSFWPRRSSIVGALGLPLRAIGLTPLVVMTAPARVRFFFSHAQAEIFLKTMA